MRNTIIQIILLSVFFIGGITTLQSQSRYKKPINQPYADQKLYHLGFFVGLETQDMIITHQENGSQNEVWFTEIPSYSPGFNLGMIGDRYINQYLNVRLSPSLHFGERKFVFREQYAGKEYTTTLKNHYLSIPVHLKFSGGRIQNARPYFLAGAYANIDISPNKAEALRFKNTDYGLEFGVGCNIYFPLFKLCPELKFSFGLTNLINKDNGDLNENEMIKYRNAVSSAKSRAISLVFNFE